MNAQELRQLILKGASLSTDMEPDIAIPTNKPRHVESYQLPFIIMQPNHSFFAASLTHHRMLDTENQNKLRSERQNNYFYSAGKNTLFGSTSAQAQAYVLMQMIRYKHFCWNVRDDHQVIWDTQEKDNDIEALRQHVRSGLPTKAVIIDKDILYQLPLDLLQVNLDDRGWLARTQTFELPYFCAQSMDNENKIIKELASEFSNPTDVSAIPYQQQDIATFWFKFHEDGQGVCYPQATDKGMARQFSRMRLLAPSLSASHQDLIKIKREQMEAIIHSSC